MCGIFGYIGKKTNAGDLVLEGLKALEYRGYDSWGVAILQQNGDIHLEKHVGKIGDATLPRLTSSMGLGHTRWATHGGVTQANAHPHTDCTGDVIIVHNGIVENFDVLKKQLLKQHHTFTSATDSEVIAHLIEEKKKTTKHLFSLMKDVKNTLDGMNAVITFFPREKTFFIFKNGSPIVIGKGKNEYFIASDAAAITPHTKQIYYLEDGEMVQITDDGVTVYGGSETKKDISYLTVDYDAEAAEKGAYEYFMLKEIAEQPRVLSHILATQEPEIRTVAEEIKQSYGTYLVGCGTASYAALAGTYLFSKIAKRHVNCSIGSEFGYLLDFLKETSCVLALSQSGETIDTIASVQKAKARGARLVTLTNVIGSTLYRMADHAILLHAGPEKAVASTKAYTAKIAFLYLIAHTLAGTYKTGSTNLHKAINEVAHLLEERNIIQQLTSGIQHQSHIFILGRGVSYPAALEAALKIKEVSYIHAEGFAAGELKHGVIALVEKDTPVILFNPVDETYDDILSSAHEVKARGAYVIGVSSKKSDVYDTYIEVKNCQDATIIPNVVIAQLLGYYLALSKGYDPDKPRNLAKSVTVK